MHQPTATNDPRSLATARGLDLLTAAEIARQLSPAANPAMVSHVRHLGWKAWLLFIAGLSAWGGFGCVGAVSPHDRGGETAPGPGSGRPGEGNTGSPGQGSGNSGGTGSTPGPGPAPTGAAAAAQAGLSPLRRLTAEQYRNTVRDLLGLGTDAVPATALPPDEAIANKFRSNIVRPVGAPDLDRYGELAGILATKAAANLAPLLPCAPAMGDAGCAKRFIESFGRRAFRRPLDAAEIGRLEKVFAAGADFPNGIRLVIEAILQSPKFLYLVEPVPAGKPGEVAAVDPWSLAARLSYFLWNSTPDEALLDAAQKGNLGNEAGVVAEAKRLMADGRFRDAVATFHQFWLDLSELSGAEKDAKAFPAWTPALKAAMAEETRRFVEATLKDGDGKLETLFGAQYTFLSGPLYDLYGVPKPANAADWQRVDLKAGERAGLLTQPALLAALSHADRTSFVRRGKMVREAIFCQDVPPPPPGVNDNEATIPASASGKERAEIHRSKPECASCHALFDPIGFAFEPFDAIGRFRTSDGGKPIEAKVDLTGTSIDGSYANIVELAPKLAGAKDVQACLAKQWLRFALGREDGPADEASLRTAVTRLGESGGDVRELLVAVVKSSSFRSFAIE